MAEPDREALMNALVTEHFVLQTRASATISEAGSRSSLYLLSLSSGLVALGFATGGSGDAFLLFAAALLPMLFLLGVFTVVRLVDTSIENVICLRAIATIRRYYMGLTPDAPTYFPSGGTDIDDAQDMLGGRRTRFAVLFTMASMIGTVNAVLGGTAVALLLEGGLALPRAMAVIAAVLVALVLVAGVVTYGQRRFDQALGR